MEKWKFIDISLGEKNTTQQPLEKNWWVLFDEFIELIYCNIKASSIF